MKTISPIEMAVFYSREIENILKEDFQAEGRGLHELLTSIQHKINLQLIKKARYIASVRNKVIHESDDNFNIFDFHKTASEVIDALHEIRFNQNQSCAKSRPEYSNSRRKSGFSINTIFKITILFFLVALVILKFYDFKSAKNAQPSENSYSSEKIYKMQKRLNELGYSLNEIDGIEGEQTKSAIYDFQYNNNLAIDGMLNKQEYLFLMSSKAKAFAP